MPCPFHCVCSDLALLLFNLPVTQSMSASISSPLFPHSLPSIQNMSAKILLPKYTHFITPCTTFSLALVSLWLVLFPGPSDSKTIKTAVKLSKNIYTSPPPQNTGLKKKQKTKPLKTFALKNFPIKLHSLS